MNSTAYQPALDPAALPGRVVDVVYLAAVRADVQISAFNLYNFPRVVVSACLSGTGPRDVHAARAVFAQLGVTEVTIDARPGGNHAAVSATVPALDDATVILTIDPLPTDPTPIDPARLLAETDTLRVRAAESHEPVQPVALPQPASEPAPARAARAGSSGERAVRFEARFDSTCPACEQLIGEGAPASWLDGDVVHDTCAEAAGIDVYDPR